MEILPSASGDIHMGNCGSRLVGMLSVLGSPKRIKKLPPQILNLFLIIRGNFLKLFLGFRSEYYREHRFKREIRACSIASFAGMPMVSPRSIASQRALAILKAASSHEWEMSSSKLACSLSTKRARASGESLSASCSRVRAFMLRDGKVIVDPQKFSREENP